MSKLAYRGIHPIPLTTYGLDLRTGMKLEGAVWEEVMKKEQVNRSKYRRASGKGWEKTDGVREITITYRPDLLMVLKLEVDPKLTEAWMHSNLPKLANRIEELSGGLQCKLILAHNSRSINHVHPKIFTVDDEGQLLWARDENGKIPKGKKGLNLLGPGKLAIMRLFRAGLIEGDEFAERAFNNRCRHTASKYTDGLPLDWSLTTWLDDETENFIRSHGPRAMETWKVVREDYKLWLSGKMKASPYNLKAKNVELENKVSSLERQLAEMAKQMQTMMLALKEEKTRELKSEPHPEPKAEVLPAPKPLSARDTMKAVFKWGNPLGRLCQDPREPAPAEWFKFNYVTLIEGTCDTPGWTYQEPKPTWDELSTIRDRLLKVPHAEQLEAVGNEVDAWFAAHPSPEPIPAPETAPAPEPALHSEREAPRGLEEVDEFEEALAALNAAAKAKEEVKKPTEEPKPQPQEEPFFAPLEPEKKEEEEEDVEDIEAEIRSLGF